MILHLGPLTHVLIISVFKHSGSISIPEEQIVSSTWASAQAPYRGKPHDQPDDCHGQQRGTKPKPLRRLGIGFQIVHFPFAFSTAGDEHQYRSDHETCDRNNPWITRELRAGSIGPTLLNRRSAKIC
jgi:hypothetical protein